MKRKKAAYGRLNMGAGAADKLWGIVTAGVRFAAGNPDTDARPGGALRRLRGAYAWKERTLRY